jgi:CheY-like chemotaxis protein
MTEARRATILLVEDDVLFQRTYYAQLADEGYVVRVANDGKQALQEIEASSSDLVLLDLLLPQLSGYEVPKRLRAAPRFAELPVIVLTNSGEREDIRRALELGATGCFAKFAAPPREVLWRVRQIIA